MREAIFYATLLAALLVGAWVDSRSEDGADSKEGVVVVDGPAEALETVTWADDKATVTIERREDDRGAYLWVVHQPVPAEAAPPLAGIPEDGTPEDGTPEDGTPAAPPADDRTVFKASEKGDELLADLSPLRALRRLEAVDGDKLAEIGLTEPEGTLTLVRSGQTTTLEIGAEAYGTRDRYVRDAGSGMVYLVDDQLLKALQYARTRLPERRLWSMKPADVATATVTVDGAQRRLTHDNPDDPQASAWTDADGSADEQVQTWMDKALKLRGTTYVDPEAADAPADLQPRFSLALAPEGKGAPETLEVLQEGADGDWYGRSEHTRGTIRLLRAPTRAVAEDVGALVQ